MDFRVCGLRESSEASAVSVASDARAAARRRRRAGGGYIVGANLRRPTAADVAAVFRDKPLRVVQVRCYRFLGDGFQLNLFYNFRVEQLRPVVEVGDAQ